MNNKTILMSLVLCVLMLSSIVLGRTVGVIDVRTNFTGEVEFPEFVNLHNRFIDKEIKVADIWVRNSTIPLYIKLFNGTNIDEEHVVFWIQTPVKQQLIPLDVNKTVNITTVESGNYTIYQRGKKVGDVHAQFEITCDFCNITQV